MKVEDILEHFLSRADWVDRSRTVDRVIMGDPDMDISRCLVTWIPSYRALRAAVDEGLSLIIGHEPLFYDHRDSDAAKRQASADKLRYIEENGLAIVRIHDSWDRWPEVGIPWAWAGHLGFEGRPVLIGANGYQHRYDVDPVPFEEFAKRVAARCASLGEPEVQMTGEGDDSVSRIGIGTGCGCSIAAYLDMGCDCSIVCDDGSSYWGGIQMAEDLGHHVIRVNHGTSEEPGMVTLARYINDEVEGVGADHLPHGSTFRLIGPRP
jgi:putative NIF3 family GTP cyclohydrolase 1 type 2